MTHEISPDSRFDLYNAIGEFNADIAPQIVSSTQKLMNDGVIPLYFRYPLDQEKVYSLAYHFDQTDPLPTGSLFGYEDVAVCPFSVTDYTQRTGDRWNPARSIMFKLFRNGTDFVRPYDASHELSEEFIKDDIERGLGASYILATSPEAPPVIFTREYFIEDGDARTVWEEVALLRDNDYEAHAVRIDEATLFMGLLDWLKAYTSGKAVHDVALAQYYCEQSIDPQVPFMWMYMTDKQLAAESSGR